MLSQCEQKKVIAIAHSSLLALYKTLLNLALCHTWNTSVLLVLLSKSTCLRETFFAKLYCTELSLYLVTVFHFAAKIAEKRLQHLNLFSLLKQESTGREKGSIAKRGVKG